METISSLRFSFTRKGELRAEITLAGADGTRSYPRIVNAAAAIAAAKATGADIRGYSREVSLKNPEAIAANGGKTSATVAEYATTPVRCTVALLGDYAEVDVGSIRLAGATAADANAVKSLVAGIALTPVVRAAKPAAAAASDENDLG